MRRGAWLAAGALAAGLALAGCSSGTVAGWAGAAGAGANDAQLVSDVQHLREGIRLHELRAVRTACEALSADAATADGELPTPDTTLTDELDRAYQDFYKGGEECYASPSFSSHRFASFERLLTAGSAGLAKAERRLGRLAPGANSATGASGGPT